MTDNPWLIMAINMTIVFAVLIMLGVLMHIIYLVDPTKKKSTKAEVAEVSSATAPSAVTTTNHDEVVAAIVAAVCAMGYSKSQIASVRPIVSTGWKLDGRLLGRNVTR
mgnify:FL=1